MTSEQPEKRETVLPDVKREFANDPDFSSPVKPIAEFVMRPDFPECVLGEHVDIGGYIGVVIGVVRQSIKVRSQDGGTASFNSHGLRRIYGPPEPEPPRPRERVDVPAATAGPISDMPPGREKSAPAAPSREIPDPDFDQPVIPIATLVSSLDFPENALGKHVKVEGYAGVVVRVVNQSVKIRSRAGTSRGYNAQQLQNIYKERP
jgi:hypothetical protein